MHTVIYPDNARLDDGLVEFCLDLIGAFLKDFGIDMFLELLFGLRLVLPTTSSLPPVVRKNRVSR